jgi:two-component system cell cycle sensor histidine kinase/response regulator CckA
MTREEKAKEQLAREVRELRNRLARLEEVEAERNAVQEVLFETQLRLHQLLCSSPAVIYTCKPFNDCGITFISENVVSRLGYQDHEFIDDPRFWIDRIHPDDAPRRLVELLRLFERGNDTLEYRFLHKDGTYRWLRDEMRLICDDEGAPTEIIGCWVDITERKGIEEALRESEVKFRTQFHLSPQPTAIAEIGTGRLIDANEKLCELTRYTRTELIGRTTTDLGFYSEEERKRIISELESFGEVRGLEMSLGTKNGARLEGLLSARLIRIHRSLYALMVFVDLTERKRLESQLEQARKMEAVATLAAGVAHEFNNALTGLVGNLHLLEETVAGNERACHYVKRMKTSALRMADLTGQLLAYAREGKYQTKLISLSNFVKHTLPVLRHGIHDGIRVETDLPLMVSPVEADLRQLQIVLSALIANAAEAIDGKGRIRIATRNEIIGTEVAKLNPDLTPGLYVHLRVEDDGKGMDEQTKARMFEPFFTTKFHGRGLGMAAVYGIVKNHNGWIKVDSELGKGTVVAIYLPAAGAPESATEDPSS